MSLADLFKRRDQKKKGSEIPEAEKAEAPGPSFTDENEDGKLTEVPDNSEPDHTEDEKATGNADSKAATAEQADGTEAESTSGFVLRPRTAKVSDIKPLFAYYKHCAADPRANLPTTGIGLLFENFLKPVLVPQWENYLTSGEIDAFVSHVCKEAERLLEKETVAAPVICSMVPQDALAVFLCVLPASDPEAAVTLEQLNQVLKDKEILPDCVLTEEVSKAAQEKRYFQIFAVAKGTPPVKGEDGKVIDHYPREWTPPVWSDEEEQQGIKSLKFVTPIHKGDVICEIMLPADGVPGSNVYGKPVPSAPGIPAKIPAGRNTEFSEDKLLLLSSVDGHIIFDHHEFHVNHTLSVPGGLDGSVGAYNFMGNIEVNGNVAQGVNLSADGDIKIYGTVEGANLTAKGHITLKNGMNGNYSGLIRSGQYVKARFLENTNIRAKEDILTESIINCSVVSGREVEVTRGSGTIMGGTIYAIRSVRAKMIGKPSGISTDIYLGTLPDTDNPELTQLQAQQKEMQSTLDNLLRNLEYFRKKGAAEKNKEMYDQLCVQADLYREKIAELDEQIDKLANPDVSLEECFVQANIIYPNIKIHIGSALYQVMETERSCRFFYSLDERKIIRGSML